MSGVGPILILPGYNLDARNPPEPLSSTKGQLAIYPERGTRYLPGWLLSAAWEGCGIGGAHGGALRGRLALL